MSSDEFIGNYSTLPADAELAKSSLGVRMIFLLNFVINSSGAIAHCGLILVTFTNKKFHSACHLLIATNSICTLMAYLLVLAPLLIVWMPPNVHLSLAKCFAVQFIPIWGSFQLYTLMPAIGFDRMLSVFWAKWYISRNERLYLCILLLATTPFPLFILFLVFRNVLQQPHGQMLCTLGEILDSQSQFVVFLCLLCITVSASCYVITWIRLKSKLIPTGGGGGGKPTVHQPKQSSIFRSLCIILCLQVCGWVLGQSMFAITYTYPNWFQTLARWEINMLVMCFLSVTAALDVPVLYMTSSDYKSAFEERFPWLRKVFGTPKTVIMATPSNVKRRVSSITPIGKPYM